MTEVTLLGGERHSVDGGVKEVERLILDAALGSIMQFASLTDTQTGELLGVNTEYVMTLRSLRSTGQPAA